MLKKIVFVAIAFTSNSLLAAHTINLYQAPLSRIDTFAIKNITHAKAFAVQGHNTIQEVNRTQQSNEIVTRYQQFYRGIRVIGGQVMISRPKNQSLSGQDGVMVNGQLLDEIQLNIQPGLSAQQAIELAKKNYSAIQPTVAISQEFGELEIRAAQDNQLKLVYLISFKGVIAHDKPVWPHFILDAQTGEVVQQWDNIKTYLDSGPGGNEKVHEYWYGKEGLPSLDVSKSKQICTMESSKVKLVNLRSAWDWYNLISTPVTYPCNFNKEEPINGAFSPANDAYYFGHTIVNMYHDWYGINALQRADGAPMQLVMRVHFGQNFDNAFWDGQSMSFGDGSSFYPLVSLDVTGHEVTHGFTQQHSGLEYHDQSGALNESLSDMAGQASRAYLLEKFPLLYGKAYLEPGEVTWGIGETIVRESWGKALRFMDFPSSDGSSADCLDKTVAQSHGSYCAISYAELVDYAKKNIANPQDQQSFIVHTASGVFNKAFYLLANKTSIKEAYHAMIIANTKYWTPTTDFISGACGVLHAADDLAMNLEVIQNVFGQVGIDISDCNQG